MIHLVRGFKDILPEEAERRQHVIKIILSLFQDFGYREICTPILEKTDLFKRSIGAGTDIIEKEMYTFSDNKGKFLTLRPEATASIVRSYIQHKMYAMNPVKRFYTLGPMFRRERPQKGRYRQFYQIDVEVFGIEFPYIEVELIYMLNTLFDRLSLENMVVHLNSLGCVCCRPLFKSYLEGIISNKEKYLCKDCKRRKKINPLRILDCKIESCRESIKNINSIVDFLCYDCKEHFNKVLELMNQLELPFKLDKYLIRGLDYYTRTSFELHHNSLGSQNALVGGGRYDNLVRLLGGPDIPAIGFAIGLDRLLEVVKLTKVSFKPDLFIAVLGEKALNIAFEWQMTLNKTGVRVFMGRFNQSLKAQMKQANRTKALYVLILGEQEIEDGLVLFKNMKTGDQELVRFEDVFGQLKDVVIHNRFKDQK